MESASVSSKELGTNCWSATRWTGGRRCERFWRCKYPERQTCKAVDAEIGWLQRRVNHCLGQAEGYRGKIVELEKGKALKEEEVLRRGSFN